MVRELIQNNPQKIHELFALSSWIANVPSSIPSQTVSEKELEQISELKTPNKVLALVKFLEFTISTPKFTIVLEDIQDPGNLGTIIRLADWFGASNIVCSDKTVNIYNTKVIQATMGSIFRIPVEYTHLETYLSQQTRPIYGAVLGGENVYKTKLPAQAVLVMGNEGNGISDSLLSFLQNKIEIPRFGQAESLNVSMATSILLSEFFRIQ
ncbi:MAG: RNA methyltransferase [Bacteroidetes bacterium]|nr:RNA methyltransferase [Bacteroidota bacterium]